MMKVCRARELQDVLQVMCEDFWCEELENWLKNQRFSAPENEEYKKLVESEQSWFKVGWGSQKTKFTEEVEEPFNQIVEVTKKIMQGFEDKIKIRDQELKN